MHSADMTDPSSPAETRAYTADEARQFFLEALKHAVRYWATLPDIDKATGRTLTTEGRCDGVAFSILNIIDGTGSLPAFDLVLSPHPDDKQFHIEEGSNWFEAGTVINHAMLHEAWYKTR